MKRIHIAVTVTIVAVGILVFKYPSVAQESKQPSVAQIDADLSHFLKTGLWGGETGAWRTRTQLYLDPGMHQLSRRAFTLWDPEPSREREFTWIPDKAPSASNLIAEGRGRLIWRSATVPHYLPNSVVGLYYGDVQNGRPDGRGDYYDASGISYVGQWVNGQMEGQGHLKLPNGDEYQGSFQGGLLDGRGRYIDAGGEIYDGSFRQGGRDGEAITTLASGVVYQSHWRDGAEIPSSRSVRLAQVSTSDAPALGSTGGVNVRILVNPVDPKDFKSEDMPISKDFFPSVLGYIGSNTDKGLQIKPDNKRLMSMWKGDGQIALTQNEEGGNGFIDDTSYGVFSYAKTLLPPVGMIIEVQNREAATIQITDAYLDVASSITDNEPGIQVVVGDPDACADSGQDNGSYHPQFRFENFGWSKATSAVLHYTLVNPDRASTPAALTETKNVGDITKLSVVNFEDDLKAAGANVTILATRAKNNSFKCNFKGKADTQSCLTQLGGAKTFGSMMDKITISSPGRDLDMPLILTEVVGNVEYNWTDVAGNSHKRTSPVSETLRLGRVNFAPECGEGSTVRRVVKSPVMLNLDQTGYRIAVPFKESLPPGRVARFSVPLTSARASQHDFSVVLELADHRTVRSRPVDLLYYYPAWFPTALPPP